MAGLEGTSVFQGHNRVRTEKSREPAENSYVVRTVAEKQEKRKRREREREARDTFPDPTTAGSGQQEKKQVAAQWRRTLMVILITEQVMGQATLPLRERASKINTEQAS